MMRTILVVDDDPSVRYVIGKLFRSRGWTVLAAESAEAAVRLATDHHIDIVLCDVVMPGVDGFGCVARVKGHQPDAAIMLMSGHPYSFDSPQDSLPSWGPAPEFIAKPFSMLDLGARVDRLHSSTSAHAC